MIGNGWKCHGLYMENGWSFSSQNWDAKWEIRGKYMQIYHSNVLLFGDNHLQKWREIVGFFTLDYRRVNGWEVGSFGTKVYEDIPQLLAVDPKFSLPQMLC